MTSALIPYPFLALDGPPRKLGVGRSQGMQCEGLATDRIDCPPRITWWLLVRGGKLPIRHMVQCRLPNDVDIVAFSIEWQERYYVGVHIGHPVPVGLQSEAVDIWGPYLTDEIPEQVLREYAR